MGNVLIIGKTGTGKTDYAFELIKNRQQFVLVDEVEENPNLISFLVGNEIDFVATTQRILFNEDGELEDKYGILPNDVNLSDFEEVYEATYENGVYQITQLEDVY